MTVIFHEGGPKSTLGDTRLFGYCAVFKVREEVTAVSHAQEHVALWDETTAVGLSKLNSMRPRSPASQRMRPHGLPGPVDMSKKTEMRSDTDRVDPRVRGGQIRHSVPSIEGSLERR